LRQAELEEEEERMRQEREEEKSSWRPDRDDDGDSDNSGDEKGTSTTISNKRNEISRAKKKRGKEGKFTVNTSYCRSELETIQLIIQMSGFT